jgi:hypothetical protein
MLLGDLIARFDDEAVVAEALLSLGDLHLTARVRETAQLEGTTAGEFAKAAVQQFASTASDDEWVTVVGLMGQTTEPGLVLLRRALAWALSLRTAGAKPHVPG